MTNEKRLIDADAVMHKINAFAASVVYRGSDLMFTGKDSCNPHEYTRGYERGILDAQKILSSQPAVDAVKHEGCKWCNGEYHTTIWATAIRHHSNGNMDGYEMKANYCPNCGAKMRGDGL